MVIWKSTQTKTTVLSDTGVKFTKEYFIKNYGLEDEDFDIREDILATATPNFSEFKEEPPIVHGQKQIEDLFKFLSETELSKQAQNMLSPLISLLESCEDYEEAYKASDTVQTLKVAGDTPLMKVRNGTKKGFDEAGPGDGINLAFPQSKTRRGRVGKGCSQTLDTSCNMGTIDDYRIRRLTPLECFRLQGFPDEMVKTARTLGMADCHLYKMAGNAVTVNVIETVAKKLAEVINGTT